jgi:phosphoribosyl 1,2-cyclic phosphate phosphodiesterase
VQRLDGVILTHAHADHMHGLAELRVLSEAQGSLIDFFMAENTWSVVHKRFPEYFKSTSEDAVNLCLNDRRVKFGSNVVVTGNGGNIVTQLFRQQHGEIETVGIRINDFAYSVDLNSLGSEAISQLKGLDTWIVDCLRYEPHPSHLSVTQVLELIKLINPQRAILTGLSADVDYEELKRQLPANVEPAFDGLVVRVQ